MHQQAIAQQRDSLALVIAGGDGVGNGSGQNYQIDAVNVVSEGVGTVSLADSCPIHHERLGCLHRLKHGYYRHPLLGLSLVTCSIATYVAVGKTIGFGEPRDTTTSVGEPSEWCERVHSGLLKEPVNAISNIGFVVTGLVVLLILAHDALAVNGPVVWSREQLRAGLRGESRLMPRLRSSTAEGATIIAPVDIRTLRDNPPYVNTYSRYTGAASYQDRFTQGGQFIGNTPIALLYGYAVLFLGLASAAMHGTNTEWGPWLDVLSMVTLIWIPVCYNLALIGRWRTRAAIAVYVSIVSVSAVVSWLYGTKLGIGVHLFDVPVGLWGVTELLHRFSIVWLRSLSGLLGLGVVALRGLRPSDVVAGPVQHWWLLLFWVPAIVTNGRPSYHRRAYRPWAVLGLLSFGVAFAMWWTSRAHHPWCRPDSVYQAHAIWHLLCALAAYFFFLFYRTERPR